jgi:tetratricopeptide (TPR) repeat protein
MKSVVSVRQFVAASTCFLGILALSCTQSPEVKSARYIESGKRFLQNRDSARAILELRNAVRATPKNAEAFYQLSLAYFSAGDLQLGVGSLRKALDLNPKHEGAQLRMAQLMSMASDPELVKDAQHRLEAMLQASPNDAEALHTLAFTELKLGESEEAMQHLARAMELAPQDLLIAASMAEAKLRQNDVKGAEEILLKAAQNSPKSAEAEIVLGRFYASLRREAESERHFQRALALDGNNADALLNLASGQYRAGRKQEAEENFKRLSGLPSRKFKGIHATFLFEEGRRDEAIREFEKLAKEDPEDRQIRSSLIAAYQAVNRMPDAERVLRDALKQNPKDSDALIQRGEIYVALGQYEKAEVDLNQVLTLHPDSAALHYVLAKLNRARGASRIYRQELSKVLQLNPTLLAVRIEAAQELLDSHDAKACLSLLDQTPDAQKQLITVLVQRNWALWMLGDLAEMRKQIDLGLARGRNSDLLLQEGMWNLRAGKFAAARNSLEEALNINPGDLRALSALNEAYTAQKQNAAALQKVKEFAARQPKSAPVQDFLGLMLMANGDRQQARAAFADARAADRNFMKADLALIQLDVLDGKFDDAKQKLETVLAANPGSATARLWLGNVEASKGNQQAALEHFRQVVTAEPSNAQALNNYAYLLAEFGKQPAEALKYAQKAKEISPGEAEFSDTLGWILYRKGLYPMAVSELERAVSKGNDPTWKYHLAMAYVKAGDLNRGRATFQAALKLNPNIPEAKLAQEVLGSSK